MPGGSSVAASHAVKGVTLDNPERMSYALHMTRPQRALSASQAAAALGVAPVTITRWIDAGTIAILGRLDGERGAYLIPKAEVDRLLAERKEEAS